MTKTLSKNACFASISLVPPDMFQKVTGVIPGIARKVLRRAFDKIVEYDGTNFTVAARWTDEESRLLQIMAGLRVGTSGFTSRTLIDGLTQVLERHRLITKLDTVLIRKLECRISAYTLEVMHRAKVRLSDDMLLELRAGYDPTEENGWLYVGTMIRPQEGSMSVYSPVFMTYCGHRDWCEPELLESNFWSEPLEVGPDGKLRYLR